MRSTMIVIAKRPVAGRVKTRLCPALTTAEAAELAAAALQDTLAAVDAAPAAHRLLYFDGAPEGWCPPRWQHRPQRSGPLDLRLADAFRGQRHPAVLVGMDTPQLTTADLTAFDPARYDACLGPANDGGYWIIGFRDPRWARRALTGVPMSTAETFDQQWRRLQQLSLRVQRLEERVDVDTIDDARTVAAAAPHTRFAAALAPLLAVSA